MADKGLTSREIEEIFTGFEKRQDDRFKGFEERVVNQFRIISEGLKDEIKLLAEGHAGIIEKFDRMEKENERQHMETRSLIKLSFTPLESHAACSGDEGNFLMGANTGFNAPREPSR